MRFFLILSLSLLLTITVIAQDACSSYVSNVLATVDTLCEATGRNELCYGNNIVSVTTISGEELNFSQPGDIVPINNIASIRTNPYAESDEWGIALMKLQANIPDSLPGQNVTFLLFGDVSLSSAVVDKAVTSLSASTTGNINVRTGPSTNVVVAGTLQSNTTIQLIGRNAASDWVYFATGDLKGWLYAPLLQIDGDIMSLDEVPDDFVGEAPVAPMQAVYFSSGIGQSACYEVPQDGILIQSPDYDEPIQLVVNDVEISLGSTVYLEAEPDHAMWVYVLAGQALLSAQGETQIVPEGSFSWVPIDGELHANGVPVQAEPYDMKNVDAVPINNLDENIQISDTASDTVIQTAHDLSQVAGQWKNIDTDGSHQSMFLLPRHDTSFALRYRDEGASVCGKDANGKPIYPLDATGEASLDGNILTISFHWACADGNRLTGDFELNLTVNGDGTMTGDDGLIWTR